MTVEIEIQNEADYPVNAARMIEAGQVVVASYAVEGSYALTIVITDNEHVAALNRQYRGVDAPTDVLSFPADTPPVALLDEPVYLGDLVIAYPYAAAQAAREGHQRDDSLALLVVHGTLHLLGYDHDDEVNRAEMWAAQEQSLKILDIPVDMVPTLESGAHGETEVD